MLYKMDSKFYYIIVLCLFAIVIGSVRSEDERWPIKRKLHLVEKLVDDEQDGLPVLTDLLYGSVKWHCKHGNKYHRAGTEVQRMEAIVGKDLVSELRAMPWEWDPRFNSATHAWNTKKKLGLIKMFLNDDIRDGIEILSEFVFRAIKFHVQHGYKFDKGEMLGRIKRIVGHDDLNDIRQKGNRPIMTKTELLKKFLAGDKQLDILKELTYATVKFYSTYAKRKPDLMNMLQRIIAVAGEGVRTIGKKDSSLTDTELLNKFLKDDKGKELLEELVEGSVKWHARNGKKFRQGDRVNRIIQVIGEHAMSRYAKSKGW